MPEIPILLECRNICKSFGQNKVLRDINLQIKKEKLMHSSVQMEQENLL